MAEARDVFDRIPHPGIVAWNALVLGYAQNHQEEVALEIFSAMASRDSHSFVAALQACSNLAAREVGAFVSAPELVVKWKSLERAMDLHSRARAHGSFGSATADLFVANALIDVYAKCGSVRDAQAVFDTMAHRDVVSWTALMLGYVQDGDGDFSLEVFQRMRRDRCRPNALTFAAAVKACSTIAAKNIDQALEMGEVLHTQASEAGFSSELLVANTLIDMYVKCGYLRGAREVFHRIEHPDVVSWNTLLLGYVENGEIEQALRLFELMKSTNVAPDARTFAAVLKACAIVPSLETGREVHREICRRGLESKNEVLQSGLVDFYGKCGSMVDAEQLFYSIASTDLVTWTALIAGYSRQGDHSGKVFEFFHKMVDEKVPASGPVLLCVLSACSHAGLVDIGTKFFREMSSRFGVSPRIEHYHCVIDLLGRANRLDEALELIRGMPFEPSSVTWKTLLGKNLDLARLAFGSSLGESENGGGLEMEKGCGNYVLMSNICRSG
ncbi:putative pentatricopeptide repeat-containing protein At1g56570 [Selaginella moellendorffii]|uniref:putative pentatricopeptide repeat-containing protein At1g56570 n=1 Tax=Selaginella moellendorffii TaxID=88036 RepID=UPI000D1CC48C|nr:putative pentatricopeptide repeat-containing protein At1g56570 [Selaginella moellendorffii]|eukprot:XP_024537803.1 putative pentatricopeptide repeat-containing protein At1g56570 [Selaginella moellendorffii]